MEYEISAMPTVIIDPNKTESEYQTARSPQTLEKPNPVALTAKATIDAQAYLTEDQKNQTAFSAKRTQEIEMNGIPRYSIPELRAKIQQQVEEREHPTQPPLPQPEAAESSLFGRIASFLRHERKRKSQENPLAPSEQDEIDSRRDQIQKLLQQIPNETTVKEKEPVPVS